MRPPNHFASFLFLPLLLPPPPSHAQTPPRRGTSNVETGVRRSESRSTTRASAEEESEDSGVWRYILWVLYAAGAWAFGLLVLFVLGKLFSNMTRRTVESGDPEELTGTRHETLRRWYRALINFAGFYYYISLPVVLCLALLAAAAVIYAFLALGRLPIKLALIVIAGAGGTAFPMIGLTVRQPAEERTGSHR